MPSTRILVKDFLRKTFDIREGEYRKVFLLQLNIFLIIFTLLIIKPVVNAQFISTIGIEKLPLVFVLVAICAMGVSTIYSKALNTRSLRKVTGITLWVSIISLVTLGILLHLHISEKLVLYILYIGVANFGVLATSQFWIMTNLAFDAREAKRLFSFIGAGPIAGGVAGGYVTSLLASKLDSVFLLFIAAAILLLCIPLNNKIWRGEIKPLTSLQKSKRLQGFGDHPFWLIRKSRHLTYLALVVGLGVIVSKLVEFQFSSVASTSFPDPDDLTAFFGFWFSTFNVVSLLIQLFLTRRIVGTFGVGTSLFALPGGVLFGSILLLFFPVLWAGVFTKLWEVSVKQSVNKAATELLALPIPTSIKSQTKSFIDVFVDMAATGLGGILLIILVNGLNLSVRSVSVLTIVILIFWCWIALKLRKQYVHSFKAKLTQADRQAAKAVVDFSSVSVLEGLQRALNNGSEKQIIYVLDKVREIPDKRLFNNVEVFLDHHSPAVRQKALECLYYLETKVPIEKLEQLLRDPELEVRFLAFAQILRQTTENRIATIHEYLLHNDPLVSGAALVGLATEARNNPEMKKLLKLEERIAEKIDYLQLVESADDRIQYKIMVLRAAGHGSFPRFYSLIEQYFNDPDPRVSKEAFRAAGLSMNPAFVARLASLLVEKSTRKDAQEALLSFGVGVVNELKTLVQDPECNPEIARQVPAVLERVDHQSSVNALLEFLDMADVMLRLEALRSLNTLQRDFPHLKIRKKDIVGYIIDEATLYKDILGVMHLQSQLLPEDEPVKVQKARARLIEVLEGRLDGTLERIFRLLGLRYPPEDVIPVYAGIKNLNPHVRTNSVEFLDNLLESSLKKTLVPIAETALFDSISTDTIANLKVKIREEHECFKLLLQGRDPKLKLAVFELIVAINDPSNIDLVEPHLHSPNPRIREQAKLVLEHFRGSS